LIKVFENSGAYPEEQKGGRKLKLERKRKKKVGPNEKKRLRWDGFTKFMARPKNQTLA
jgi:hypothetical protein